MHLSRCSNFSLLESKSIFQLIIKLGFMVTQNKIIN